MVVVPVSALMAIVIFACITFIFKVNLDTIFNLFMALNISLQSTNSFLSLGLFKKKLEKTNLLINVCTIFTIENGLLTKDHTYYDNPSEK